MQTIKRIFALVRPIALLIFCLWLLISGIQATVDIIQLKNNHSETTAIVVDLRRRVGRYNTSWADFQYTVDGTVYRNRSSYLTYDLYIGKEVVIYYNPDNPNNFIRKEWVNRCGFPTFLVGGFRIIVGVAGVGLLIPDAIRSIKNQKDKSAITTQQTE